MVGIEDLFIQNGARDDVIEAKPYHSDLTLHDVFKVPDVQQNISLVVFMLGLDFRF